MGLLSCSLFLFCRLHNINSTMLGLYLQSAVAKIGYFGNTLNSSLGRLDLVNM